MMLAWMTYTVTVSALLSLAAHGAEQVAQSRRAAARWIWALTMAVSLALPAAMPSLSIALPHAGGRAGAGAADSIALRQLASPVLTPAAWAPRPLAPAAGRFDLDRALRLGWMALSAGLLAALAGGALYLERCRRCWSERTLAGATVYVSDNVGPAVVGLLRHRIVVPAWLPGAPAQQQRLVIAHEQSHLAAADPQLLTLALLALVAMPWNLPLWWQWRRLRLAVEVDCDARVLAAGHDLRSYGAALIDVGARHAGGLVGSVAAMAASRSALEHRIGLMVRVPARWKRRAAPLLAALSLCMVAVAAQVGPPDLAHQAVALPAAVLQSYAGYYQLDENRVMIVAQAGENLSASINMVHRMKLVAESGNGFFMPGGDLQVSFVRPPNGGAATGLVLRQGGITYPTAARTGAAAVEAADAFMAERYASQNAVPGGEQILRRNLELSMHGQLQLNDFSPEFGAVTQRALPLMQPRLQQYGAVRSVRFVGVNRVGWDMYLVQYEHGELAWHLWFDASGKVSDAVALNEYHR
ncbi:MAG: M56 family metallopeptidase [Pseudomonadota bacterium]|nr:M56 family metallopeptidase [Pseudomonadota bacterium]